MQPRDGPESGRVEILVYNVMVMASCLEIIPPFLDYSRKAWERAAPASLRFMLTKWSFVILGMARLDLHGCSVKWG